MSESTAMNCFDWNNRVSDSLDGILNIAERREADEHLDNCGACRTRFDHFRSITHALSSQSRRTLPVALRRSPLSLAPLIGPGLLSNPKARWNRLPWTLRTGLEGIGLATVILLGVAAIPRVRTLYEQSIERRLDAYLAGEAPWDASHREYSQSGTTPGVAMTRGRSANDGTAPAAPDATDDFSGGEASDSDPAPDESDPVHVGATEVWRFHIKTDSPREVRNRVINTLIALNIPKDTPGLGGVEAPGGIQFSLYVPRAVVNPLKLALEKLTPPLPQEQAKRFPGAEAFTWYKNRSRKPVPSGQAKVIIWLSQI